jgi:hypothetical protein
MLAVFNKIVHCVQQFRNSIHGMSAAASMMLQHKLLLQIFVANEEAPLKSTRGKIFSCWYFQLL